MAFNKYSWEASVCVTLLVINCIVLNNCASGSSEAKINDNNSVENSEKNDGENTNIAERIKSFRRIYQNNTFNTGNNLWDGILNQCSAKPTISCLQKNVFQYLDSSLTFNGDVNLTNGICFKKNRVDYNKYSREANMLYVEGSLENNVERENEIEEERSIDNKDVEEQWNKASPIEEVTDALYDKTINFMMSHDMNMKLPEIVFDGATLKLSPRALTKTGALVHIEIEPKKGDVDTGRIFFKKIKKYFKKKLVMAALSIFLLVVLIKLKIFFVLPLLLGVGAAQKLLLKFILFMFPAVSNVFKLCGWYHNHYQVPKYHHHHHLVSHHHHKVPIVLPNIPHHGPHHHVPSHGPQPVPVYGPPHHSPPVYGPPATPGIQAHVYGSHEQPLHEHYQQDWELSGPGLGSDFGSSGVHRNAIVTFKPDLEDAHSNKQWNLDHSLGIPGQGADVASGYPHDIPGVIAAENNLNIVKARPDPANTYRRPLGSTGILNINKNAHHKDMTPKQLEKEALLRAAELAQRAPPSPVRDEVLRVTQLQLKEQNRIRMEQQIVEKQQNIISSQDPDLQKANKFYGALVSKVERILESVGATDPGCRERAVCSLYQDPSQHTPYSNLVSNELSRDSAELPSPSGSKSAIIFYKYVQAARDGQEQKNCLTLYPVCTTDFHKKRRSN